MERVERVYLLHWLAKGLMRRMRLDKKKTRKEEQKKKNNKCSHKIAALVSFPCKMILMDDVAQLGSMCFEIYALRVPPVRWLRSMPTVPAWLSDVSQADEAELRHVGLS